MPNAAPPTFSPTCHSTRTGGFCGLLLHASDKCNENHAQHKTRPICCHLFSLPIHSKQSNDACETIVHAPDGGHAANAINCSIHSISLRTSKVEEGDCLHSTRCTQQYYERTPDQCETFEFDQRSPCAQPRYEGFGCRRPQRAEPGPTPSYVPGCESSGAWAQCC